MLKPTSMRPTFTNLINPFWWFRMLHAARYTHYFTVGVSGVLVNLGLTAFFAELIFGRENYFTGYVIALVVSLIVTFILHTRFTFKTRTNHTRRLVWYLIYSILLTVLQAFVVRHMTAWVGVDWYLVVIAVTIFVFSTLTFLLFKLVLFREKREESLVV